MTNIKLMQSVSYYVNQLSKKKQAYEHCLKRDDLLESRKKLLTEITELEKFITILKNQKAQPNPKDPHYFMVKNNPANSE